MQAVETPTPHPARSVIEINGISLSIDGRPILEPMNLRLTERRIGIIGRNGSGKTSLARLICGLVKPDHGEVRINGADVYKDRKAALSEIGIIFQNPDHQIIFPTVQEEIAFGVRQQGHDAGRAHQSVAEALDRFGVADWAERAVSTLSQGQKHLVCLISVLAMKPSVIVLDEPFTGLDYPTSQVLRHYLQDLDETVIHITHDMAALDGFDRVIWIEEGRVEADGPVDDVRQAYRRAMENLLEGSNAVTHLSG